MSLSVFLSFASGLICIDQSKLGTAPLTNRKAIIVMSIINLSLLNGILSCVLALVSLVADKNQPDGIKQEDNDDNLKLKINELKKLKEDKVISQKEFLDMLTRLLVE